MGLVQTTLNNIRKNPKTILKITELYNQENGRRKVAELLKVNYGTVGHILKELGLQSDKITRQRIISNRVRNRDPFDDVDFGDYLKGFILGDGSIGCDYGEATHIVVSTSDLDLIEAIRNRWDSNLTLKGPTKDNYSLVCRDRNLVRRLMSWGFTPAKSKVGMHLECAITWPLIRGLFDSDGCITYSNNKTCLRFYLYGHPSYMSQICEFLKEYNPHIIYRDNLMGVAFYKQDVIKRISSLMYESATIKLNRKYERFQQHFKY